MFATSQTRPFSIAQARNILGGKIFAPKAWIYWTDFLVSWIVGAACFRTARMMVDFSPLYFLLVVVAALAWYRAVNFIHELAHLRAGTFRGFRAVWNLLIGIPFLIPSFIYYIHLEHHRRKNYGTDGDGEYIRFSSSTPWAMVAFVAQALAIPLLPVIRFGVLTPLTWFSPRLRDFVHRRASSMIIDPRYVRPLPLKETLRIYRLQEVLCLAYIAAAATLISIGVVPTFVLAQGYAVAVICVSLNQLRTLGAHRWNGDGGEMTFEEQLVDSVNYPNSPLTTGLWAPIGLRFHGLHHIFPTIPYHNLAAAHYKLMESLPADSIYRRSVADSLWSEIKQLWGRARASRRESTPVETPRRRKPRKESKAFQLS